MFILKYIKDVFGALRSLVIGMKRTLYYFTHHKEIITEQYPDNRDTLQLPERFKGK
jgi:NADH-quinone oxidoreductase subunit I